MNSGNYVYGTVAVEMLRDIQRNNRLLDNPFDEESKRKVIDELNSLFERCRAETEKHRRANKMGTMEVKSSLLIYHLTILRNKRCLMAYTMERTRLVKDLRWEMGSETIPPEIEQVLSPSEKKFRTQYNTILRDYMNSLDIDLTLNLEQPPTVLNINVKVLRDSGTIETSTGPIALFRGNTLTMRKVDAEPLIKLGILQHIPADKM